MTQTLAHKLDWDRIRSLRGVVRIAAALKNLGMPRISLLLSGGRAVDNQQAFYEHPMVHFELRPVCQFIQTDPEGKKRCAATCFSSSDPVHTCHAGLKNLIVPIVIQNKSVGYFGLGQYLDSNDDATRDFIKSNVADLKLDSKKLSIALDDTPTISSEKREVLVTLLGSIITEISSYLDDLEAAQNRQTTIDTANFHGIITKSKTLQSVLMQIPEIAKSNSSIMIYGESGTGKERLATIMHQLSDRKDKNLVTINCAALTETILESELFGFKKGAFTNAFADKQGLFEKANGGTMFLDEIGDMPLTLQVKLLRVLQEGTFIKVGDTEVQKVDVRILAATNKSIPDLVAQNHFRQDLYYRLAVIELHLPPLRERREDIPILVDHFLQTFCQRMNKKGIRFSPESLAVFAQYEWPGNVRELQNEVERSIALSNDHTLITPEQLSKRLTEIKPQFALQTLDGKRTMKDMVSEYEKAIILKALQEEEKWNKTKIAEKLGLTRQGLLKKIEKYQIDKRKR